jgi:GH25 family lysozyme M1 (1,4-beta-N-acetylmuramidase)
MTRLLSSTYRKLMLAVFTVALSGVFTALPTSAEAATPASHTACGSWIRMIDISSNNRHPIDFSKLPKAGIAGMYIKNSEATNYVNPFWKQDVAQAVKYGIPYGSYYFAQPGKTDPVASAKFFVKNGGALGQFPPALDLEVTKLNPEQTAKWALTWLQSVQALSGRKPIIYVGYYFPASQYGFLAPYDLWLPAYPNGYKPVTNVCTLPLPKTPAPWAARGWSIWQYSSIGHPGGMYSNTDMSAAEAVWFSKWTGTGIQPPTPGVNKYPQPIYAVESHGAKVVQIQRILIGQKLLAKGSADGVYGEQTKAAVKKWQAKIGVKADGMWSAATETATRYYLKNHTPKPTPVSAPVLKIGSVNYTAVRNLQGLLNKHGARISVDGVFGKGTDKALRTFQKSHHLPVTGVTTQATWVALWK